MWALQEVPRLPESLIHPEAPMAGVNGAPFNFKMPGMDGWSGAPSVNHWQPPPQQQQQQPPQQQQAFGQDFQRMQYLQQLFPQQKPGASIGLEHVQVSTRCLQSDNGCNQDQA